MRGFGGGLGVQHQPRARNAILVRIICSRMCLGIVFVGLPQYPLRWNNVCYFYFVWVVCGADVEYLSLRIGFG